MEKATTHKALPLLASLALLAYSGLANTAATASDSPSAPLNERILTVPVDSSPLVRLKVTVYMPSRGGPFPLALINHGASHDPANAPRIADNFIPYYFLSRGYAVAMPMMRGYAGSEGAMRPHGCDLVATGMDAARDIRKVLDYVKQQPGVDASRIIMVGKSMGGWNTLVFGAQSPPDVKGLVSFAGGLKESDCHEPDASLINGADQLGAHTKLHSIWFFGDNDQTFATSTWRGMFRQYAAAGAPAELVDYGVFQKDAHAMTASAAGLPLWVKKADAFLTGIGMPVARSIRSIFRTRPTRRARMPISMTSARCPIWTRNNGRRCIAVFWRRRCRVRSLSGRPMRSGHRAVSMPPRPPCSTVRNARTIASCTRSTLRSSGLGSNRNRRARTLRR